MDCRSIQGEQHQRDSETAFQMKYDVFMSYAREDAMAVRSLVSAFEAEGHTVFWDRHIQPGQHWSDVLENAMRESRVVVVVWSAASVTSAWVKAEATEAMAQRKLVPVRIDSATIPMPFGQVQTADIALNRPLHEQGLSIAAVMAGLRDAGVAAPGVSASPTLATGSAGRVVDWRHAFLSMEGRLGRRDYWICYLALVPISVVCIVLVEYLVGASAKDAALDVKVKASVLFFFLRCIPALPY